MRYILASSSPRRRELLSGLDISFEIRPALREERSSEKEPSLIAKALSLQKADEIAEGLEEEWKKSEIKEPALVIGADTLVSYKGEVFGKPSDLSEAERMLLTLQGRTHEVYTGVTLIGYVPGEGRRREHEIPAFSPKASWEKYVRSFYVVTEVSFYPMTGEEIESYLAGGESMDKAGAYGIQGSFARYVKEIAGDYYNVVGLPISRLYHEMQDMEKRMKI